MGVRCSCRWLTLLTVLLCASWPTRAAGFQEAQPTATAETCLPVERLDCVDLPPLDLEVVEREDLVRGRRDLPPRFAIPKLVSHTPDTSGTWEAIEEERLMWRFRISSLGARSINLGFTRYLMPAGGRLWVYASDLGHVLGPFTDFHNETHGQLWTPLVPSDDIVIEVTIPTTARRLLGLELGSVNIGYRDFGKAAPAASGACNVDVICPEGDAWRDQIQSVGVISLGGSTFCTGFLVNNTAQDLTPYFMTAYHCGISSANAASLVVYWNYQNSWCRPPDTPISGGPGDGSLNQYQTGSFFRAAYPASDMTLVELDDAPDPLWRLAFAGWDRSESDPTSAVGIHHPDTAEKRISFEDDPTTTTSYLDVASPGDGTHIRVIDWDVGTTEGGSSGSPLFNQNHRVVGQLHGGDAACGNDESDWYGRFSVSWSGGGSDSSRLSNWLDPGQTGANQLDLLQGGGLTVTPGGEVLHIGAVGGPFTNPVVTYTLRNPLATSVDYSVSLTTSFGLLLNGGTAPVVGTLAPGGTVDVIVTLGSPVNVLPAGLYEEEIQFADLTNAIFQSRRHMVEVGQTLISVTPEDGLEVSGPVGGPFPGSTVYSVASERATPVLVEVSTDQPWISLNGVAGPIQLSLDGLGSTDTVSVAVSAAADALIPGAYEGTVNCVNLVDGRGDASRSVSLVVGRVVYPSTDTPLPIDDHTTVRSELVIADDFCVGDIDIDVDISHTWIGDLTVALHSPSGSIVRLHDRTGEGTVDLVATYDDEGMPPDGPGLLADFHLEPMAGVWTLVVTDNATVDTGTLNSWSLRIAPYDGACLIPMVAHAFPLDSDPGWATEGLWAYGRPLGGGSHDGDPTGGHTGDFVYGYNLSGDYGSDLLTPEYLTTSALDCSNIERTSLRFYRWLGVESASFDHAGIEVSSDGSAWTTVWEHTGATISDSSWSLLSYDISAVADLAPTVFIRWAMGPTDAIVTYPGWNIDDIEIRGVRAPTDCNENGIMDRDEIEQGLTLDCNGDWLPDECQVWSLGDFDLDTDVGLNDYLAFAQSIGGPNLPPQAAAVCLDVYLAAFDADADLDIDQRDFATLQRQFSRE